MPALAATTRFIMPGVSKIHFLPAISAYPGAATRAEITAGTDLTGQVAEITGFSSKTNFVEVPDMSSKYAPKIVGRTQTDDSSIEFYTDITGTDVRQTLQSGTSGFIVFMDGGDVPTQKMDQWKVTVGSVSVNRAGQGAGTKGMTVTIGFALTATPGLNVSIPA